MSLTIVTKLSILDICKGSYNVYQKTKHLGDLFQEKKETHLRINTKFIYVHRTKSFIISKKLWAVHRGTIRTITYELK